MSTSLKTVYNQLLRLEALSATNDKIALLETFLKDELFVTVAKYALSSDMVYHINKVPVYTNRPAHVIKGDVLDILENLAKQDGTTDTDKLRLFNAAAIDGETHEVVKRIVQKDLKCGVGPKTINNIQRDVIYYVPYCRCSSDKAEDKFWSKKGQKYAQLKEDGMFVNVLHYNADHIDILTRNGKDVLQLDVLKGRLAKGVGYTGLVNTGELLVIRDGKVLNRQTGNGILNKLLNGTAPQSEADSVAFRAWDALPIDDFWNYECSRTYTDRWNLIQSKIAQINDLLYVNAVYTEMVEDKEEADDFYRRMRILGEEGSVLKWGGAVWKDHTSPNMIKKKNVSSCALKAVDWKPGKADSKYEDVMGAVMFESSCGKLQVSINGKDDKMRGEDWNANMGQIWTVDFNYVSFSKNKTTASLYLPRLAKPRPDRTAADTLAEIVAREKKKVADMA